MKRGALFVFLLALPALADTNINVDANAADWSAITSCVIDPTGDGSGGIDIDKICYETNRSNPSPRLFMLYTAATPFPTNTARYFGFIIDRNNDGAITSAGDEAWGVYYAPGSSTPTSLNVYDPINFALRRTYTTTANCGGTTGNNGWSSAFSANPAVVELGVSYACLGMSATDDVRYVQGGVYPNFDLVASSYYDPAAGTVTPAAPPPEMGGFTLTSGNQQNRLRWTNPALHQGTLVVRSTTAVTFVPTKGTSYTAGQNVGGNHVVRFFESSGSSNSFTDTGLTNGTRYFYKVYNHHQHRTYSPGDAPNSNGLFGEPTAQTGAAAKWCYSFGFPSLQQPVTELGAAVFTASNGGAVVAARTTSSTPSTDGDERFRPAQLNGAIQSRPTLVPVVGGGRLLFTGDQTGRASAVNPATGAVVWTSAVLGDAIQAQPAVQLTSFANAAYNAVRGGIDLVFVATRNGSTTNNKVYALNAATGAIVWTYSPGNMDIVNGGMAVDYTNNKLFVAGRGTPSFRVLNSITGAQLATLNLGATDYGVNLDFVGGQASQVMFVNTAGTAYGISVATNAQVWTSNIGATTGWIFPTGNSFIASFPGNNGRVRRYSVSGSTVSQMWQSSTTIPNPTGVTLDYANNRVYVASSDGNLRQLNVNTGAVEKVLAAETSPVSALGMPTLDATAQRIHVGTQDGRLCAFPIPFP